MKNDIFKIGDEADSMINDTYSADMQEVGDFKIAKGYTSIFMGATSSKSASGRGYVIEETYSIGQYDSTDWESGGTGGTGGTSSTN